VTGEIGLWDTAGQERYRTIVPLYVQNAAVVLLCFDVTSTASFDSIEAWHELVMSHSPTDGHFFLIGNKSDLVDQRTVPLSDAQQKSENLNADVYIETSAATGMGLNQILSEFGRILADRPPENDGSETKDGSLPTDSSLVEADRNQCC
jgi:small GTP-binding protein